jgi:hypothetical protein
MATPSAAKRSASAHGLRRPDAGRIWSSARKCPQRCVPIRRRADRRSRAHRACRPDAAEIGEEARAGERPLHARAIEPRIMAGGQGGQPAMAAPKAAMVRSAPVSTAKAACTSPAGMAAPGLLISASLAQVSTWTTIASGAVLANRLRLAGRRRSCPSIRRGSMPTVDRAVPPDHAAFPSH